MEQYRSGHNGHDWKSCVPQKGTEGSNPSCSATKETSFVYQDKRGFFVLSGAKQPRNREISTIAGAGAVKLAAPAPVFAFNGLWSAFTFYDVSAQQRAR